MHIITISDKKGSFIFFPLFAYLFPYLFILFCFIGYGLQRTILNKLYQGGIFNSLETKLLMLLSIIFAIYSGIIDQNKGIPSYS